MLSRIRSFFTSLLHRTTLVYTPGAGFDAITTPTALGRAVERVRAAVAALMQSIEPAIERGAAAVLDNKWIVIANLGLLGLMLKDTAAASWLLWAVVLIIQNFAFTYVSRARNSGSLMRHMKAGVFSNGVWFASQTIILAKLMDYITGKHGLWFAVFTGLFYTLFTLTGSVLAHYSSMKSEKGASAVGASKKYAQITREQWDTMENRMASVEDFAMTVVARQERDNEVAATVGKLVEEQVR